MDFLWRNLYKIMTMIVFSEENVLKVDCGSLQKNVKNLEPLLNL